MSSFLSDLIRVVALQIVGVFGIFFVFSFILDFLQTKTQTVYRRSVGWKGILWTAWIGTPIHELSHALAAKIFRHKIERIDLFHPNEETGNLGSVNHSYNPNSLYQKIGNFFIGAAPLIAGPFAIILLLYILIPDSRAIVSSFAAEFKDPADMLSAFVGAIGNLFSLANVRSWRFWLFVYLAFAIVIHMAPSRADQKNLWRGFFLIALVLVILNACALILRLDITAYVLALNRYLVYIAVLFIMAIFISVAHLAFVSILFAPFRRR